MTTLVIGSTGKTGRRIVRRLNDLGTPVRGASRRSTPRFDWQQPSAWPAALQGVTSVYVSYHPDLAAPGAPDTIRAFTTAATRAGVRQLVLLSGRGESNAQRCEQIVRESRLSHTLIRASWFFQNFTEGDLLEPVLAGTVALPAGMVGEPFVDVNDIADVAVAALTGDQHDGRLYELTGPRLLTFAEATAEMSEATGRDIRYAPISLEQFHAALTESVGPDHADLLTGLCREVFDGRNQSLGRGVQEALGREPRDFADFCRTATRTGVWTTA
ncbi:NmrA family transcriptional regulator [Micromonospora sp. LOL_024]|uniref:NmrA family transcriptional regulator n=1 Tax=Micromonospora sp. LOL_024 TaxID=3345412 RepID=UPI003A83F09A